MLVQHFDKQQIRSNLNFFVAITSILTFIKTNKHQNNLILGNSLVFYSVRVGIKHRLSDHVMADISHVFLFLSFV